MQGRSFLIRFVAGHTLADDPIIVVAKLAFTGTLVIITVYRDE